MPLLNEDETHFLSRQERARRRFSELNTVSDPDTLLKIDRRRLEQGGSTKLGAAIRDTVAKRTLEHWGPEPTGLFNRVLTHPTFSQPEQRNVVRPGDSQRTFGPVISPPGPELFEPGPRTELERRGFSDPLSLRFRDPALHEIQTVNRITPDQRRQAILETQEEPFGGLGRTPQQRLQERRLRTGTEAPELSQATPLEFGLTAAGLAGSLVDRVTGAPLRGAALGIEEAIRTRDPGALMERPLGAFINPETARGVDLPGIRNLPDPTVIPGTEIGLRDIVGFGAELTLDVTSLAGIGAAGRIGSRGGDIAALSEDLGVYSASRLRTGARANLSDFYPDSSTMGILREADRGGREWVRTWQWEPPPVPEGHVRLWRGEPLVHGERLPGAAGEYQGRWFTPDRAMAERFSRSPYTGMAGDVKFIDVPESQLDQYHATPGMGSGQAGEYVLPPDLAQQARYAPGLREKFAERRRLPSVERATDVPFRPRVAGGAPLPDEQMQARIAARAAEMRAARSGAQRPSPAPSEAELRRLADLRYEADALQQAIRFQRRALDDEAFRASDAQAASVTEEGLRETVREFRIVARELAEVEAAQPGRGAGPMPDVSPQRGAGASGEVPDTAYQTPLSPAFHDPLASPAASIGNSVVAPLRPLDEITAEVRTSTNPVYRSLAGRSGINPSVLKDSDLGRLLVGYQRQLVATEELTTVTLAGAIDAFTPRGGLGGVFGRSRASVFHLGSDGRIKNIEAPAGAPRVWQDVFTQPHLYKFSDEQRAVVDAYHRVIRELEAMRRSAGLKPRGMGKDGYLYVPRRVEEVRGILLRRGSNPDLPRFYELAEEGLRNGVRYDLDPRNTLALHVRAAYREVAEAQLDAALTDLSLTAKEIVGAVNPGVVKRMERAVEGRKAAERAVRSERALVLRSRDQAARDLRASERRLDAARRRLAVVQAERRGRQQQRGFDALQGRRDPESARISTPTTKKIENAKREVNAAQRELTALRAAAKDMPRIQKADVLSGVNERTKSQLTKARTDFSSAQTAYRNALRRAQNAEIAPGHLFGYSEAEIPVAQWRGRFYPAGDAKQLRDFMTQLEQEANPQGVIQHIAYGAERLANLIRIMGAGLDFAAPFLQGQAVAATSPGAWAKGTARHYQAFLDPRVFSRFVADHHVTFQKMARNGVPVGDPEFFAAIRRGGGFEFVDKAIKTMPKGEEIVRFKRVATRQSLGRFESSYNAGLAAYRALVWEAMEGVIKDEAELGRFVRNLTGGLDSRALGAGPTHRRVESWLLGFSPRYTRSTFALVGMADPRTPVGRRAIKTLATWATAGAGLTVMAGLALGKDWEEIETALNPLSGKRFLAFEVDGDWIGVGGQIRSLLQFIAAMGTEAADVARGDFDNFGLLEASQFDNPIIGFWMSRGAPGVTIGGGAIEALSGGQLDVLPFSDITGPISYARHLGSSLIPFTAQGQLEGEQAGTGVAAFMGARTSPQTPTEQRNKTWDAIAERMGERDFETLSEQEGRNAARQMVFDAATPEEQETLREIEQGRIDRLRREKERGDPLAIGLLASVEAQERISAFAERNPAKPDFRRYASAQLGDARVIRGQEPVSRALEALPEASTQPERDVSDYLGLFDQATDPETGELNHDELSALEGAFIEKVGRERWERVLRNLYSNDDAPPLLREWNDVKFRLSTETLFEVSGFGDASFFDRDEAAWSTVQERMEGTEFASVAEYPSYFAWRRDMISKIEEALRAGGEREETIHAHALSLLPSQTVSKEMTKARQKFDSAVVERRPDIAALAIDWGYMTPTRDEIGALNE